MCEDPPTIFFGMGKNAQVLSITESFGQGILFLLTPFWSLFVLDLGASISIIGFLAFVLGATKLVFQPIVGYLTDRLGRKKLVVWGGFLSSFAPFIYFFSTRWEHLIIGVFLEAFNNIVLPARQAMFADSVEPERRATAFATIHTLFAIFSAIMPIMGGFLIERVGLLPGMRVMFLVAGVIMILASFGRWIFLSENYIQQKNLSEKLDIGLIVSDILEPVRKIKALQVVLFGAFLYSLAVGILTRYSVVYATRIIGLSTVQWGFISSGIGAIGIFTRIPTGRMIDRFGRKLSILISYTIRPVFIVCFTLASQFNQVLLIQMIDNLIAYVQQPALEAMMVDISSKDKRGRVFGSFNIVPGIALTISPMIGAFLWNFAGETWPFYLSALFCLLASITVSQFLGK
jgi:DHA1 family multidrug resistance protein-like MFS transporter